MFKQSDFINMLLQDFDRSELYEAVPVEGKGEGEDVVVVVLGGLVVVHIRHGDPLPIDAS